MSVLRLALPIRTSERKRDGLSPRQQRERAEEVVRRSHGRYEIARVFDSGKSESGKTMDRASLREIRAGIRSGEFDGCIVGYLDRLGRAPIEESMAFVRGLIGDGGVLVAADWGDAPIDLVPPSGYTNRHVESMLVNRLQMNRDQWLGAAERHRENATDAKKRGKFVGQAGFGYAKERGRLVEHPVEGEHLRETFRRVAAGTLRDGVDYLVEHAPTRTRRVRGEIVTYPSRWNTDTVRDVLASRTYLGEHGAAGVEGYKPHDALVSVELWQAAQAKLDVRAYRQRGEYMLSTHVHCAECDAPLVGAHQRYVDQWQAREYRRYRCATKPSHGGNSVDVAEFHEWVRAELRDVLADRAIRDELMPDGVDTARETWEQAQARKRAYGLAADPLDPEFADGMAMHADRVRDAEAEYRRLVGLAHSYTNLPTAAEVAKSDARLVRALEVLASRGFTLALRSGRGALDDRVVWRKHGVAVSGVLAA